MLFETYTRKRGTKWLIQAPALDLLCQGASRQDACAMLKDAVEVLINKPGFKAEFVTPVRAGMTYLRANDRDAMLSLMIRRQRQKYGLTLAQAAKRLGASSPNAFARYEQGKARPTIAKLLGLLEALSPEIVPVLKLAA